MSDLSGLCTHGVSRAKPCGDCIGNGLQDIVSAYHDGGLQGGVKDAYARLFDRITTLESELSASKACEAELREKLESENNLKNLYHGELLQTADQRNELAKKLEAYLLTPQNYQLAIDHFANRAEAAEAKLKEISEAPVVAYFYSDSIECDPKLTLDKESDKHLPLIIRPTIKE